MDGPFNKWNGLGKYRNGLIYWFSLKNVKHPALTTHYLLATLTIIKPLPSLVGALFSSVWWNLFFCHFIFVKKLNQSLLHNWIFILYFSVFSEICSASKNFPSIELQGRWRIVRFYLSGGNYKFQTLNMGGSFIGPTPSIMYPNCSWSAISMSHCILVNWWQPGPDQLVFICVNETCHILWNT